MIKDSFIDMAHILVMRSLFSALFYYEFISYYSSV